MPLIIGLHRRTAPPEMPDCAVWRSRRRRLYFVEEQIHVLALNSVKARQPRFLRHIEGSGVEINRLRRVGRIQVDVMEAYGARWFLRRSAGRSRNQWDQQQQKGEREKLSHMFASALGVTLPAAANFTILTDR